MRRFNLFLIAFFSLMVAAGCSDSEEAVVKPDEPEKPVDGHTLVFYMMGDGTGLTGSMDMNLLALRGVASQVVSESNHLVIFYDRGNSTQLMEIVKENGRIKEKLIKEYTDETAKCVDPQFMADAFKLIDRTCKSDSYGVVFSSHGGGWVSPNVFNGYIAELMPSEEPSTQEASPLFCGQDGLVYMEIPEMASAIEMSGLHFDYIIFDACYMSSIEAIYDLRHATDYVIASPCEILAGGLPYTQILPMLFTEGHMLQDVCKAYVDHYQALSGDEQSAVIALTDCSKLDELARQVRNLNQRNASLGFNKAEVQAYEGFATHLFYDLEHYCEVCSQGNISAELKAALSAAIPYSAHTDQFYTVYAPTPGLMPITRSCGVSCFVWVPESEASHIANDEYKLTAWAKALDRQ